MLAQCCEIEDEAPFPLPDHLGDEIPQAGAVLETRPAVDAHDHGSEYASTR
jgi:hypothetical protein